MSDPLSAVSHQLERKAVVADACSWIGTPFRHMGCIKGAGVDCAMSVYAIYRAAVPHRVPKLEIPAYSHQWHLSRGAEERYLVMVRGLAREIAVPRAGDLVLYRIGHAWSHGGIVIDWPLIAHADATVGQFLIARGDQGHFAKRPRRFFTIWPELTAESCR